MDSNNGNIISHRQIALHCTAAVTLLWFSGPPSKLWPLAMVAIVPWLKLIQIPGRLDRRGKWIIVAISTLYWMTSLQGLRHAHPAIYAGWLALSAYLAVYHLLFIWLTRRLIERRVSLQIAAPLAWMTTELVRNYLLSGISVLMLGHAMADVPAMIQIADLAGTYGVGWVLMVINVAFVSALGFWKGSIDRKSAVTAACVAAAYLVATLGYGIYRVKETPQSPAKNNLATFLLLQRNEEVDYLQSQQRELEIFEAYSKQAVDAVAQSEQTIDAVVWPESMFSGGAAWMIAGDDMVVPAEAKMPAEEFAAGITQQQDYIQRRARYLGELMIAGGNQSKPPAFIAGSGVVRYAETPQLYSSILHVDPSGDVAGWYGKMHLVMFGEYIPILPWIPGAKSLMPPGMGLATGKQPGRMRIGDTIVSPNICIETAVERVTGAQVHWPGLPSPDVVVTVTNDGWFDDSSLIDHHLRCVQLVAAGVRRPILSAANNGPTAWIDDRGAIVERLPQGKNGTILATPKTNDRISFYTRVGDWPMRLLGVITLGLAFVKRRSGDDSDLP